MFKMIKRKLRRVLFTALSVTLPNAIRRTYALPPDVNPAVISTADFEMFGQQFTFAYVVKQPTSSESFIEVREVITIETRSRNLTDILPNLEQEIWYDQDGFAGTLVLDIHSITSEAAGVFQGFYLAYIIKISRC
jgi:hypothetical protein